MKEKILLVLDVSSREEAMKLVRPLSEHVGMFKVGMQLFTAEGPSLVREIVDLGGKVFLDLKFHDIPNTVSHAVLEAAKMGVSLMTIHAAGGRMMMETVARELEGKFGKHKPMVVAVTVLTSLNDAGLAEVGISRPMAQQVEAMAKLAEECGIAGVVCSPQEIELVRRAAGMPATSAARIVGSGRRWTSSSPSVARIGCPCTSRTSSWACTISGARRRS